MFNFYLVTGSGVMNLVLDLSFSLSIPEAFLFVCYKLYVTI